MAIELYALIFALWLLNYIALGYGESKEKKSFRLFIWSIGVVIIIASYYFLGVSYGY